jgi:hypothetical protein
MTGEKTAIQTNQAGMQLTMLRQIADFRFSIVE